MDNEEYPESFWETLKDISQLVLPFTKNSLQTSTPSLGSIGPPAAALAGIALTVFTQKISSAFTTDTETLRPQEIETTAARTTLAEAILQTVLALDTESREVQFLLADIEKLYSLHKPHASLSAKLFPFIAGPLLRLSLGNGVDQSVTKDSSEREGNRVTARRVIRPIPDSELSKSERDSFTDAENAFATRLLRPTVCIESEGLWFDKIGSFIKSALLVGSPLLKNTAKKGIAYVVGSIKGSADSMTEREESSDEVLASVLFRRAVMAECALQTILKMDVQDLEKVKVIGLEDGEGAEEGFFATVMIAVQVIGRRVVEGAPDVMRNAGVVAGELVGKAVEERGRESV